jgi:hypothetical protein
MSSRASRGLTPSALAIALIAFALLGGRPAEACVNATQEDLDKSVANLKIADAAVEVNELAKARLFLEAVLAYLSDAKAATDPKDGKVHLPDGTIGPTPDPGLIRRVARLRALVRSRDPKSTSAVREEAVRMFEREVIGPTPDPAIIADYAEILSRVPARATQATMLLRTLSEKDLIGSAQAYAALADLEKQAGDRSAETAAREKCRTRTKKPTICA